MRPARGLSDTLLAAAIAVVFGSIAGTLGAYVSVVQRLSAVETAQVDVAKRLDNIEKKLDLALAGPRSGHER